MSAYAHRFWDTQPVGGGNVSDDGVTTASANGPILVDAAADSAAVSRTPLTLPDGYAWTTIDVEHDAAGLAALHALLEEHYVEGGGDGVDGVSTDALHVRLAYSEPFLRWALMPPRWRREWIVGVVATASDKLVASITAVPITLAVPDGDGARAVEAAAVNFLCVHRRLRARRLTPVLIRELTRRISLCGVWQAVYTAGAQLPQAVASCRYVHRPLDVPRLLAVGFMEPPRDGDADKTFRRRRTLRYRLPHGVATTRLRRAEPRDVAACAALLRAHWTTTRAQLHQCYDDADVAHLLFGAGSPVRCWVRDGTAEGAAAVTDLVTYFALPSRVLRMAAAASHALLNRKDALLLNAAYALYTVATTVPLSQLLGDALILARDEGFHVYNALTVLEYGDADLLTKLRFLPGNAALHYYLYNWRCAPLSPERVGVVLM